MPKTLETVSKAIETLTEGLAVIAKCTLYTQMEKEMHALIASLEPGMTKMHKDLIAEYDGMINPKTEE